MKKVIIVDDEAASRSVMRHVLEGSGLSLQIVGEAADGIEGMELFQEVLPDLVLMDVSMPFKDGLTVLQEMRQLRRNVQVIIVTGHGEFEYAHKALNEGARFLLLKPIVEKELLDAVDQILRELEEQLLEKARWRSIGSLVEQNRPLLQRNFLEKLMVGSIGEQPVLAMAETLGLELRADFYFVACMQLDAFGAEPETELLAVENILRATSEEYGIICKTYSNAQQQLVVLFGLQAPQLAEKDAMLQEMSRTVYGFSSRAPSMGIGGVVAGLQAVRSSYLEAQQAVSCRRIAGGGSVTEYRDVGQIGSRLSGYTSQDLEAIAGAYRNGRTEAAKSQIRELFRRVRDAANPEYSRNLALEILMILRRCMAEWGMDVQGADACEKGLLDSGADCTTDFYETRLIALLEELSSRQEEYMERRINKKIQLALEFIQESYQDQSMCVQRVAEYVGLSVSYFCSLFFEQTDVHFNEYLTQVRIGAAKQLLRESVKKVFEIALEVGFSEPKYFSAKFKKIAGCTPREYREQAR